jgi:hypothetical protein
MTQEEAALVASMLLSRPDVASWFTDANLKRLAALKEHRVEWMKVYVEAKRQRLERELAEQINEVENRERMTAVVHFSELPDLPDDLCGS